MAWRPLGKHKVGFLDLEWLGSDKIAPLNVDPKQHLVGRILYPCDSGARHRRLALRSGVPWQPDYNYARGVAKFLFFRARGIRAAIMQRVVQNFGALVGSTQMMDLYPGAALAAAAEEGVEDRQQRHPVVVFSHGLGANRYIYTIACAELASHGYVVLMVEHADGSASACKLAGGKGWMLYGLDGGLGPTERQNKKLVHRVEEMRTAAKVLRAMDRGEALPGLRLSHGVEPSSFLRGALDFNCLAAMGHSFGGGTVTELVAQDPDFRCGVAFDPWWVPLPGDAAALERWRTQAPLLVMASHDWTLNGMHSKSLDAQPGENRPCRQEKILAAASAKPEGGAGSMLLVISGSSHNTFADPPALLSERVGWVLEKLGLAARLDPVLGIHLVNTAALNFLSTHLPLTPQQRAMQSWEPSKEHAALDKIKERTTADQAKTGFFATVFPRGKGVLNSLSDALLNRALRVGSKPEAGQDGRQAQGAADAGGAGANGGEAGGPDDVLTAEEFLETALPSGEPASGPHPHAPSQPAAPVSAGEEGQETQAEGSGAAAEGAAGDATGAEESARRAEVLAGIGGQYSAAVQAEEVEQVKALLGPEHIFKCEVYA